MTTLDLPHRELRHGTAAISLTPAQAAVLAALAGRPGPWRTAELLRHLPARQGRLRAQWGSNVGIHVCRIRALCRRAGIPDPVATVPGGGYRIAGEIEIIPARGQRILSPEDQLEVAKLLRACSGIAAVAQQAAVVRARVFGEGR